MFFSKEYFADSSNAIQRVSHFPIPPVFTPHQCAKSLENIFQIFVNKKEIILFLHPLLAQMAEMVDAHG